MTNSLINISNEETILQNLLEYMFLLYYIDSDVINIFIYSITYWRVTRRERVKSICAVETNTDVESVECVNIVMDKSHYVDILLMYVSYLFVLFEVNEV